MKLELHFAPGACSRVALIALEESGRPYETRLVAFMRGDHRSGDYLSLNPAGKVPVLIADGVPLAQNVAILTFLARAFPDAELLPFTGDPIDDAQVLGQLAWCASDLHPLVTRIRLPHFFCDLPGAPEQVRGKAETAMRAQLAAADARLQDQDWWFGDRFSLIDAYLHWIWFRITGAGFDGTDFPRLAAHFARMAQRTSVQRALAREAEAEAQLEALGLAVRFPPATPPIRAGLGAERTD